MGPLPFYLLAMSLLYNAPLIVALWVARNRIGPFMTRWLIATGFASATGYALWRLDWFDVWRHGLPGTRYLMFCVPYLAGAAAIGWLIGRVVARPVRRRPTVAWLAH